MQMDSLDTWLQASDENEASSDVIIFSDAVKLYVDTKSAGRSKTFHQSAARIMRTVVETLGDRPLDLYSSSDAIELRNQLLNKDLSKATIQRVFSSVKAITNFAINELCLEIRNPFNSIYLPEVDDSSKRIPVKGELLRNVQNECVKLDDEARWLVALISDTGMRLSEAAGLLVSDIHIDSEYPYVTVSSHPHRSLKTASSNRMIPLCGFSLWAAKRALANTQNEFCFPKYNKQTTTNANSASAALNKWMKSLTHTDIVIHGMRHGLRDRLRDAEAPTELIDRIGGWSLHSVGQSYGDGYEVALMMKWMQRITNNGFV